MELDELKKSWQTLDKKLESVAVTDTDRLSELITNNRLGANQGLQRLLRNHWWSFYGGGSLILLLLVLGYWEASTHADFPALRTHILTDFFAAGGFLGILWDRYTYRFIRSIRIAEMSVAEVSRRMAHYRRIVYYELWALSAFVFLFNILTYWINGWYELSASMQAIILGTTLLLDALFIGGIYWKIIFKPLKQTERHLKQLEELCAR